MKISSLQIAKIIDHTLLKPDAVSEEVRHLCEEALEFGFATVCINPVHVRQCADQLVGSEIGVCTVVGFPLGASSTMEKVATVSQSLEDGAVEFDMVMNIGAFKEGNFATVGNDIKAVVDAAESNTVKVIIETCLLKDDEKKDAAMIVRDAGAHFVKTSTGFSLGGATLLDVTLLRETVGHKMGIKASGGIKSFKHALSLVEAGASRLGASAGVYIVTEAQLSGNSDD